MRPRSRAWPQPRPQPRSGELRPRVAIGIALNIGFVVIEAARGIAANSLALLADAGHNLGDVLGW
jgi:cobalt-zinc-cadmium efflux system protein